MTDYIVSTRKHKLKIRSSVMYQLSGRVTLSLYPQFFRLRMYHILIFSLPIQCLLIHWRLIKFSTKRTLANETIIPRCSYHLLATPVGTHQPSPLSIDLLYITFCFASHTDPLCYHRVREKLSRVMNFHFD